MKKVMAALSAAITVLSACSRGAPAEGAAPERAAEPAVRVVKTYRGEVEIPAQPQRIVLLAFFLDHFTALGQEVAGTLSVKNTYGKDLPPYLEGKTGGGISFFYFTNDPDLEAVMALEPDLIIGYRREGNEKVYDQLSRIAPTILAEHEWGNVKEALREFGGILGREDRAAELIAEYEALASGSAEKIREALGTEEEVMFLQIRPKTYRIYGQTGQSKRILYNDLGLKPLANFPANEQWLDISMEGIFSYNPGHIVIDLNMDQGARDLFAELSKSRTWNNLDAVKRGNVYVVEDFNGSTIGPIGSMDIINKLTAQIVKRESAQGWGDEACPLCGFAVPPFEVLAGLVPGKDL
jgi:iron complex transport system substrate-binding protein